MHYDQLWHKKVWEQNKKSTTCIPTKEEKKNHLLHIHNCSWAVPKTTKLQIKANKNTK